ncbi:hypothetical protein V8B97DRAFT_2018318 [Scleroderma yunnanense]
MSNATSTSETNPRDAAQPAYSNLLGITRSIPKWLPISFLAVSSAALVVPIVMLRRYKTGLQAATTRQDIRGHASPRRRHGTVVLPGSHGLGLPAASPPRVRLRVNPSTDPSPSSPKLLLNQGVHPSISRTPTPQPSPSVEDTFNGPLFSLKALAISTAFVAFGASASVFGVMAYLGVNNTSEFAARMRLWVISTLPILSERIHRPSEAKDNEGLAPLFHSSGTSDPSNQPPESSHLGTPSPHSTIPPFDMAAAQARLAAAYDRGGFYGWGEAAIKELETEAEAERARRAVSAREGLAGSGTKAEFK